MEKKMVVDYAHEKWEKKFGTDAAYEKWDKKNKAKERIIILIRSPEQRKAI